MRDGIEEIIEKNIFNLPLLEIKELKIFEFGNCFTILEDGVAKEWRSLCMAMDDGKKNKNYLLEKENILNQIKNILNLKDIKYVEIKNKNQKENCLEINFDDLILDLKVEDEYVDLMDEAINKDIKYKIFWTNSFYRERCGLLMWSGDKKRRYRKNYSRQYFCFMCFNKSFWWVWKR